MGKSSLNISLEALHQLCKGDKKKELTYLNNLLEMMSLSIVKLKLASKNEDRPAIMKELHFMSPQLVFYGIEYIADLMEKEKTKEELSIEELKNQLDKSILKIENVLKYVEHIIDNQLNLLYEN